LLGARRPLSPLRRELGRGALQLGQLPGSPGMNAAPPAQTFAEPRPANHPAVRSGAVGVLIVNLGTPEATDYWSMRRYLKEFLSDRRVIETPAWLWWPILNLIILTRRPSAKGRDYDSIWNRERNEGPLKTITSSQAAKLGALLTSRPTLRPIRVEWAMRYGKPSIASRLAALQQGGCDRILLVPLYPQYCAATSATVCDKAFDALKRMRWQPTLRVAAPYYDDPVYIEALAASTRAALAQLDFEPDAILASFHGIPRDYFDKGDPYFCHCAKTTRLLREALGLDERRLKISFQSRFGRAEWLKPYTDETVTALAREGVKRLAVLTPGFAADCLETLEEIAVENAGYFRAAGGERFAAIPCLNDGDEGLRVLETVVRREVSGWI
jgi:ferrochelatase